MLLYNYDYYYPSYGSPNVGDLESDLKVSEVISLELFSQIDLIISEMDSGPKNSL